jgi:cold shock protein
MRTGTVIFFHPAKGFGFIEPDDGGPNVFLPLRIVQQADLLSVAAKQRVRFEDAPAKNGKGPAATIIEAVD